MHMDVCAMPESSIGGHKYFLSIIDDYSKRVEFLPISNKSQVFLKFKEFAAWAENQIGRKIKNIRSDNSTEFINKHFQSYCRDNGINQQTSVPYTPQQNGVAERYNRTILDRIRCMLFDADLPKKFWGEAGNTAVFLINRRPKEKSELSAEEKFTGE